MKAISVQGSGDRWFWCAWLDGNSEIAPDHSDYSTSKDEAIAAACDALKTSLSEVEQIKSAHAKQWRGITSCKFCGCSRFAVGSGKAQHYASLYCFECDRFVKWLSFEQFHQIKAIGRVS